MTMKRRSASKKTTEDPPEPETPATGGLKARKVDLDELRKQFDDAATGSGAKTPFLKFKSGTEERPVKTRIRIVQLADQLFVKVRAHGYMVGGQFRTGLCLDTAFRDPETMERLLASGALTRKDYEQWSLHGDPFNKVAEAAKAQDVKLKRSRWPQTKFLYHAVDRSDDSLYVFEAPKQFHDFFQGLLFGDVAEDGSVEPSEYDGLLDPDEGYDIVVSASGEKIQRRYNYLPSPKPTAVTINATSAPDLVAVHDKRAVSFEEKVKAILSNEPEFCSDNGFTLESFGLA